MLENEKFRALSKSLADGFFADNAILALSKLNKGITLSVKDEDTLLECADFFAKRHAHERYYQCMALVNGRRLPDEVLGELIRFFTIFGREKLHETDVIIGVLS